MPSINILKILKKGFWPQFCNVPGHKKHQINISVYIGEHATGQNQKTPVLRHDDTLKTAIVPVWSLHAGFHKQFAKTPAYLGV